MERIANNVESTKSMKIRDTLTQFITLGMIASTVLIIWKVLMCLTGSESPVVVQGDILFLHISKAPVRIGEIVVYNVEGRPVPIVHRVIKVPISARFHLFRYLSMLVIVYYANPFDDRSLYANGQHWLKPQQIIGRATELYLLSCRFVPYVGWATIIMTEKPIIKYMFIGVLGLLVITSKD
ncbi:hypothetical protein Peur_046407 [Populus x canadensis]